MIKPKTNALGFKQPYKSKIQGVPYTFIDAEINGKWYALIKPFRFLDDFWAFADPLQIPFGRFHGIGMFVHFATVQPNQKELIDVSKKTAELLRQGKADQALALNETTERANEFKERKWINLSTGLLFTLKDNIKLGPTATQIQERVTKIQALPEPQQELVIRWSMNYLANFLQTLKQYHPDVWTKKKDDGKPLPFVHFYPFLDGQQKAMQSIMLQMVNGDSSKVGEMLSIETTDFYTRYGAWIRLQKAKADAVSKKT